MCSSDLFSADFSPVLAHAPPLFGGTNLSEIAAPYLLGAESLVVLLLAGWRRTDTTARNVALASAGSLALGLAWHQLRYESLVEDFEGEMRKVCDFLGVEWDEQMRNFAELSRARTIKTPSSVQVLRGLYREGAGQWRRYEAQLAPALPILQPWIERYGYA